jgi:hypothetical protein
MEQKSLTEIGILYNTDKAKDHKFTEFYDNKFSSIRNNNLKILEIGIWKGESLKMWKDYFLNSEIYGVDITNLKHLEEDRIFIEQADQTDVNTMNNIFPSVKFDIIIDDGGHSMYQQQLSLVSMLHRLKKGGFYILEDLHTSLGYHHFYNNDLSKKTTLELISNFSNKVESFDNFHVNEDYLKIIYDRIEYTELYYTNNRESITSILKKKD